MNEQNLKENQLTIDYDSFIENETVETTDPIEKLKMKATENLERIGGLPGMLDILRAFKERDDDGKLMTVIEFRKSFFDVEKQCATHGYPVITSMDPEIKLEQCGGYTTVVLKFEREKNHEMNRIWNILVDYGTEQAELGPSPDEIPVMSLTVVPMLLGGQYGMAAHDPIFYHMQPSDATQDYCDEIRIVFEPESVAFLRDDSFTTESVIEEVKQELASEKIRTENIIKQIEEEEAFAKQHDVEIEEYRARQREERRRFIISADPDKKFQDSEGIRKGSERTEE